MTTSPSRALACTVLLVTSLAAATAFAEQPTDVEVVEEVEVVQPEAVEVVGAEAAAPSDNDASGAMSEWTVQDFVSRLHPATVHMPIGWLILAIVFELTWLFGKSQAFKQAGFCTLVLTVISFVPASVTGLARLAAYEPDPSLIEPAVDHRNVMFGALALLIMALGMRWSKRVEAKGLGRGIYVALLMGAFIAVLVGGHMGGRLVFGDDYLPF